MLPDSSLNTQKQQQQQKQQDGLQKRLPTEYEASNKNISTKNKELIQIELQRNKKLSVRKLLSVIRGVKKREH